VTSKILLTGGCVLTLGVRTPNFTQADVLIDGDVVAEVGPGLRARDAEQVDATDTIVMPGFVDTHRHAWTSLFRNLGEPAWSGEAPMPAAALGDHYRPEDVYAATLIGLLGAAEAGITTVVDWSLIRSDDGFADAALQAHADAGLRTVFVHAAHRRGPHRRGRTVDQHRLRVRPARVDRSRQGRRRVGTGPGAGFAHPRPRRFGGLGAWRDLRYRRAGAPG
jgi:cytosine/adenosine deaminase-related metal-dependent hydrolase